MKVITLLFCFFFSFLFVSDAQTLLQPQWQLLEDGPNSNGQGEAWGLDSDPNGKLFWSTNLKGTGWNAGLDIFTYKLNPDSTKVWPSASQYYFQNNQQAYVTVATDSVVYVGGRFCNGVISTCDMYLMALENATGDTLWTLTWDQDTLYEELDGLEPRSDGIYLTGWTETDSTDLDMFLMKTDHQGNIQWTNTWGTSRVGHQDGHIVMDDSMIYVGGLYDGDPSSIFVNRGLNGKSLLAKFSRTDGAFVDSITFGRSDSWFNFENVLGMTSDGSALYLTGSTTPANNDNQVFTAKYDKNLNPIWYREWGGDSLETSRTVKYHNGNLFVFGTTSSPQYNYGGKKDGFILSYDPSGTLQGFRIFGDSSDQGIHEAHIMGGYMYVTGSHGKLDFPADKSAFLAKFSLDSISTNTQLPKQEKAEFEVYPNPANNKLWIENHASDVFFYKISMFDMAGRKVVLDSQELAINRKGAKVLDLSGVANGTYILRLVGENNHVERKKVIVW